MWQPERRSSKINIQRPEVVNVNKQARVNSPGKYFHLCAKFQRSHETPAVSRRKQISAARLHLSHHGQYTHHRDLNINSLIAYIDIQTVWHPDYGRMNCSISDITVLNILCRYVHVFKTFLWMCHWVNGNIHWKTTALKLKYICSSCGYNITHFESILPLRALQHRSYVDSSLRSGLMGDTVVMLSTAD